jgi:hypothetical protein
VVTPQVVHGVAFCQDLLGEQQAKKIFSVICNRSHFRNVSAPFTSFTWAAAQLGHQVVLKFTPASICQTSVVVSVAVPNSTTNCCSIDVPTFGCVDQLIAISASSLTSGLWSSSGSGSFGDMNHAVTTFTALVNGTFLLSFSSPSCNVSQIITIVSPPLAIIPSLLAPACGSSVFLGASLKGGAVVGSWSASGGTFDNPTSAFTLFSWNVSGSVTVFFLPSSSLICNAPANYTFTTLASCPTTLSTQAVIAIAVGATLGGLIFLAVGALAAIKLYQKWNRNLVKFRANQQDVRMPEYKF